LIWGWWLIIIYSLFPSLRENLQTSQHFAPEKGTVVLSQYVWILWTTLWDNRTRFRVEIRLGLNFSSAFQCSHIRYSLHYCNCGAPFERRAKYPSYDGLDSTDWVQSKDSRRRRIRRALCTKIGDWLTPHEARIWKAWNCNLSSAKGMNQSYAGGSVRASIPCWIFLGSFTDGLSSPLWVLTVIRICGGDKFPPQHGTLQLFVIILLLHDHLRMPSHKEEEIVSISTRGSPSECGCWLIDYSTSFWSFSPTFRTWYAACLHCSERNPISFPRRNRLACNAFHNIIYCCFPFCSRQWPLATLKPEHIICKPETNRCMRKRGPGIFPSFRQYAVRNTFSTVLYYLLGRHCPKEGEKKSLELFSLKLGSSISITTSAKPPQNKHKEYCTNAASYAWYHPWN
jgi:hypothetical protein